jgi:hypothetical protein
LTEQSTQEISDKPVQTIEESAQKPTSDCVVGSIVTAFLVGKKQ